MHPSIKCGAQRAGVLLAISLRVSTFQSFFLYIEVWKYTCFFTTSGHAYYPILHMLIEALWHYPSSYVVFKVLKFLDGLNLCVALISCMSTYQISSIAIPRCFDNYKLVVDACCLRIFGITITLSYERERVGLSFHELEALIADSSF
jgi:hypothetical protein